VGNRWTAAGDAWISSPGDSVEVLSLGGVHVPAGSFANAFHVEKRIRIPHDFSRFHYWIVPGHGIVKIYHQVFVTISGQFKKETWELLSFTLRQ
jgi:hypothetical protein